VILLYDGLASDDVITSGALCTSGALFFQTLEASFLLILLLSFVLPEPLKDIKFCLWSCTLEQILAYPIDNF